MSRPSFSGVKVNEDELREFVTGAKDKETYQRWMAIWLSYKFKMKAEDVASALTISVPAVWKWMSEFRNKGKSGLARSGRGGRRSGLLSLDEESAWLKSLGEKAQSGLVLTIPSLRGEAKKKVGQEVSDAYIYRLLHRHGWRKLMPRPKHPKSDPKAQEEFKKNCPVWFKPLAGGRSEK